MQRVQIKTVTFSWLLNFNFRLFKCIANKLNFGMLMTQPRENFSAVLATLWTICNRPQERVGHLPKQLFRGHFQLSTSKKELSAVVPAFPPPHNWQ
jgi:hypothetical protein